MTQCIFFKIELCDDIGQLAVISVRYTAYPSPIRVRSGGVVGDIHHCSSRGVDSGWGPGSRQGGFWEPLHRSPECFLWPAAPPCPAELVLVFCLGCEKILRIATKTTVSRYCLRQAERRIVKSSLRGTNQYGLIPDPCLPGCGWCRMYQLPDAVRGTVDYQSPRI